MDVVPGLFCLAKSEEWSGRLLEICSIHATVTGVLAGFSITAVVLLTTLGEAESESAEHLLLKQTTIGLFLVAFISYIATTILYSAVPERTGLRGYFLYAAAHSMYQFSSVMFFLGLYPLFEIVSLRLLRTVAKITIAGAILGGFFAAAIPYHDLLRICTPWLLLVLGSAFAASRIALGLKRPGSQEDLKRHVGRILSWSCGFVILVFTVSILMFFGPGVERWEPYLPIGALAVLFVGTSFSFYVPFFMLRAIGQLPGVRAEP